MFSFIILIEKLSDSMNILKTLLWTPVWGTHAQVPLCGLSDRSLIHVSLETYIFFKTKSFLLLLFSVLPQLIMPPLTLPSRCYSCLAMSQKISKLKGRIFVLYQLKDEEQIMDSMMVTVGPAVTVTTSIELHSTIQWLEAATATAAAPGAHNWAKLGAKLGA